MGLLQTSINCGEGFFLTARQRRWLRRTALTVATILVLYGILGFLVAPYALRRVLAGPVATSIHRAITVSKIRFNPYRLRLEADHLHVSDINPQRPFVDIGHLRVKVSLTSLFRLAPIIGQLFTHELAVRIVRPGEQTFNCSDLIGRSPSAPPATPSK